jgi:hypothetical protein
MNPEYWTKVAGSSLSYDEYVKDPAISTLVAVAELYQKALEIDFHGDINAYAQYMASHGGILSQQQIYMALQGFRGSPYGKLNQAYAQAVQECAKSMQVGNWQRGRDWIYWYLDYDSKGKCLQ